MEIAVFQIFGVSDVIYGLLGDIVEKIDVVMVALKILISPFAALFEIGTLTEDGSRADFL